MRVTPNMFILRLHPGNVDMYYRGGFIRIGNSIFTIVFNIGRLALIRRAS